MSKRGKGEGTVYYRKSDDRWVAELTLEDGKRKYFYAKTQEEVIQKQKKAEYELKQGILATGPKQKLKDHLERWFEDIYKRKVRQTTYKVGDGMVYNHLLPGLGYILLQKLTTQQIQSFYNQKLDAGLSASFVRNMHGILHQALADAVKWKLISYNPSDHISLPPAKAKVKVQTLTQEQARQLLEAVRGHHLEPFVFLALTTGMRIGELLSLRWEDITFDANGEELFGVVYVHHTVSHRGRFKFIEGPPKTASSERTILIPSEVCDTLKQHQLKQNEQRLYARRWQERGLVFSTRTGNFLQDSAVEQRFHRFLALAGLPDMRVHDLRHSAASLMLSMGVNMKHVQQILGHSTFNMTMDTYAHVLPSMQKEAIEKLKGLF